MNRSEIKSIIESIMFAYGEPISIKELKQAINEDLSPKEIEYMLNLLKYEYEEQNRGIQIIKLEDIYSNILQNGVEPIEISKPFLMKNGFVLKKLLVTFDEDKFDKFVYLNDGFTIELYIPEKNACLNVARLIIHKNNTGNMIDVKLNYVHELQQAFRMCNLQYVADNFKI